MLAVFLLNVGRWFQNPFSVLQLISWLLLSVSALLILLATYFLWSFGQASRRRKDAGLHGIEKSTVLVTRGPYRFIRHPMYSSLLFLAWGIVLKRPTWVACILGFGATALLVATAKAEEKENSRFFGPKYDEYMKRTKRFVFFLF